MFRFNPVLRITLGLVLITISILLLVDMVGLLPDRNEAVIEGRKALAESLAIQYSVAAQKRDINSIKASMRILVQRNPDVLSAALRTADGRLLAASGDHNFNWTETETSVAESTATHARVPIFRGSQQWGQVEISFMPVAAKELLGFSVSPLVSMITFIAVLAFIAFLYFIKKTHAQIDPDAVVPKRVKYALDALAEGVLLLDDQGRIMMANSSFANIAGIKPKRLMGRNASNLGWTFVNPKESEFPWAAAIRLGKEQTGKHLRISNVSGDIVSLVVNCAPVKDSEGNDRGVMATFDDVTQLEEKNDQLEDMLELLRKSRDEVKRQNDKLQVLATRDSLTNCLNRRSFFEKYEPVFNTAQRENHELSCIMLDIDYFKSINDRYGHTMGDEVIRCIAETMHKSFRSSDTVCRYGGEEFCIVLPGLNLGGAIKAAERARMMIESKEMPGTPEMKITASLGVSSLSLGAENLTKMIDEADKALYTSKNRGRNCVSVWASGEEEIQQDMPTVSTGTATTEAAATDAAELPVAVNQVTDIPAADTGLKSDHDTLTGLPNRNLFHDQVTRALSHCRENSLYACVLMLDLDMFKRVNNALGYSVGDRLLKVVSDRLTSMLRDTDSVSRLDGSGSPSSIYRLGGDEFGILLSEMDCSEFIPQIVKRIIKSLSERIEIEDHEIYMTSSVGISLFPGDSVDTDTILKHASTALFHAKAQGHNNYLFYEENLSKSSFENMKLESDLRHAIKKEEFELYYQPKIDLGSGRITGMEALLRWRHPESGMIPPDEFIPIAEATGLITVIGKWVMRTACNQIRAWNDTGYETIDISVNLSAVQFKQGDLLQQISEILDETGVAPHRLELEITENTIMDDIDTAAATLRELHKTGVQISIDDFGTGYSSLSYLKRFPINTVKIDRAFIRDITTDTHDAAIVKAVLTMSHNMGLKVVAEGIETVAQLDYLRELQCDEIQGYLFSPPVPYDEAETFLEDGAGFSNYLACNERAVS